MNKLSKAQIIAIAAIVVLAIFFGLNSQKFGAGFGLLQDDRVTKSIGTSSAPLTLTSNFADSNAVSSTAIRASGMRRMTVSGQYVTKNQYQSLTMKVQYSTDNGNTYFDHSIIQDKPTYGASGNSLLGGTSSTVYVVGATSTSSGIPWNIGTPINTSGTTISFTVPPFEIAADYVRLFFQESTTGTHGTIYSQVFLTN